MSKTRKYYFYLNTEKDEQAAAISLLEQLSKGKRSEEIKNIILSGFSLKKIDERLPLLVASLLAKPTSLSTLSNIISAFCTDHHGFNLSDDKEIVAWQKRVRDPLLPNNGWSVWISITEAEYLSLMTLNEEDVQVRALIGAINDISANEASRQKVSLLEQKKPAPLSPHNVIINKANKLFNT